MYSCTYIHICICIYVYKYVFIHIHSTAQQRVGALEVELRAAQHELMNQRAFHQQRMDEMTRCVCGLGS